MGPRLREDDKEPTPYVRMDFAALSPPYNNTRLYTCSALR